MKFAPFKLGLLSVALLLFVGTAISSSQFSADLAQELDRSELEQNEVRRFQDCCDDEEDNCSPLKVANLCAHRIKAKKLCTHRLNTQHLEAEQATVHNKLCAQELHTPNASVGALTANSVCSNGVMKVADFQQCGKYRATASLDGNITYTLGDPLDFTIKLDDPNNNLLINPFSYTAPLSGYYFVTVQVDQFGLQPFDGNPLLGIPIANLELLINGVQRRRVFSPYLAFHDEQFSNISGLISLVTGDVVTARYNVLVQSDAGFAPIAGTVELFGDALISKDTVFKIHLLSVDCLDLPCGQSPVTCETQIDQCCPQLDCVPCQSR